MSSPTTRCGCSASVSGARDGLLEDGAGRPAVGGGVLDDSAAGGDAAGAARGRALGPGGPVAHAAVYH